MNVISIFNRKPYQSGPEIARQVVARANMAAMPAWVTGNEALNHVVTWLYSRGWQIHVAPLVLICRHPNVDSRTWLHADEAYSLQCDIDGLPVDFWTLCEVSEVLENRRKA